MFGVCLRLVEVQNSLCMSFIDSPLNYLVEPSQPPLQLQIAAPQHVNHIVLLVPFPIPGVLVHPLHVAGQLTSEFLPRRRLVARARLARRCRTPFAAWGSRSSPFEIAEAGPRSQNGCLSWLAFP